ncbi:hypothetical protein FOT90_00915 [Klebsiella aerogenes]|uniref:hypothetical protein n=1 Tax=Klebsiella aerogenes TaxID=548 RepID=UPI00177B5BA8|nr:hypothetical protein [Klebsiella aerogenes]MBE0184158.1 hypothetical protein [Klebsiella aerogenes]MBE0245979.1 hypothetical protein [Klebsiella aerogenes]
MNKEKLLSASAIAATVIGEAIISTAVGASGTYDHPATFAGVMLFIGLEAMRHWRMNMRCKSQ